MEGGEEEEEECPKFVPIGDEMDVHNQQIEEKEECPTLIPIEKKWMSMTNRLSEMSSKRMVSPSTAGMWTNVCISWQRANCQRFSFFYNNLVYRKPSINYRHPSKPGGHDSRKNWDERGSNYCLKVNCDIWLLPYLPFILFLKKLLWWRKCAF